MKTLYAWLEVRADQNEEDHGQALIGKYPILIGNEEQHYSVAISAPSKSTEEANTWSCRVSLTSSFSVGERFQISGHQALFAFERAIRVVNAINSSLDFPRPESFYDRMSVIQAPPSSDSLASFGDIPAVVEGTVYNQRVSISWPRKVDSWFWCSWVTIGDQRRMVSSTSELDAATAAFSRISTFSHARRGFDW